MKKYENIDNKVPCYRCIKAERDKLTTENARLEAKVGELEEIRRAYQNIVIYESKIKERYTEENNQIGLWILDGMQMEDEEVKQLIELIDILEEKLEALKEGA